MSIRAIRREKRLTQNQLSTLCGVSRVAITRYETGKRNPNVVVASRIASALNVSLDELLKADESDAVGEPEA